MVAQGTATIKQFQNPSLWNSLFAASGNFALSGWGAGFYIFLGAFWIGDDLESKMIWNIAVARKKLPAYFSAKLCQWSYIFYSCILLMKSIITGTIS